MAYFQPIFYCSSYLHRGKVAVDPSDHTFGCDCSPCVDFTEKSGIMGFAAAVLIANVIRVAAVILLGLWKAGSGPKQKRQ